MKSYRPKLLREGTVAVRIRSEMLDVLSTSPGSDDEGEVFWDGCDAVLRSWTLFLNIIHLPLPQGWPYHPAPAPPSRHNRKVSRNMRS